MQLITYLLFSMVLYGTAQAELVATPIVENCLRVAAAFRCNEAGRDFTDGCGEDDSIAIITTERLERDRTGDLILGEEKLSTCTVIGDNLLNCGFPTDLTGTFRLFIVQKGFFEPKDNSPEDCKQGFPVTL